MNLALPDKLQIQHLVEKKLVVFDNETEIILNWSWTREEEANGLRKFFLGLFAYFDTLPDKHSLEDSPGKVLSPWLVLYCVRKTL